MPALALEDVNLDLARQGGLGFHFQVMSVGECVDGGPGARGGTADKGLVHEERTPFAGLGAVVCRAAEEFDLAGEMFDEAGGAERGDEFVAIAT